MSDGITTGYQHALWLLGYLLGLLPVLAVVALLILAALTIGPRITHRVRVHRLRTQTRRTGRSVDTARAPYYGDLPAQPFGCHCASLPPGRRDMTGHEPGCPDHPASR